MSQPAKNRRVNQEHQIELTSGSQRGLYVRCKWNQDRFQHEIGLLIQDTRIPVLESCEGNSDDIWPISPPLQQIQQQQIEESQVLLAIGMSGASHFSTSMLLRSDERMIELQIESACVVKAPLSPASSAGVPIHLGSRMRCCPDFHLLGNPSLIQTADIQQQFPSIELTAVETFGKLRKLDAQRLEVVPRKIPDLGTAQWKYRIQLN